MNRQRYRAALLLSLPALVGLVLFHYWPILQTVYLSFTDYKVFTGEFTWAGFKNYTTALQDPVFINSLKTTVLFFLFRVPVQMALGLALALLIVRPGKGSTLMRAVILLPTVTSMVVVSVVWGYMMHPENGLINSLFRTVGLPAQGFLTDRGQALPSVAAITIWKEVGLSMIFYLAGLLGIPSEYYDAAKVDGAGKWETFRHVTLPLLRSTHVFVLVTTTIAAFKVFVPVRVLTDGGPSDTTNVIVNYIFNTAFVYNRFSYAAALSAILALILIVFSILQLRLTRERD